MTSILFYRWHPSSTSTLQCTLHLMTRIRYTYTTAEPKQNLLSSLLIIHNHYSISYTPSGRSFFLLLSLTTFYPPRVFSSKPSAATTTPSSVSAYLAPTHASTGKPPDGRTPFPVYLPALLKLWRVTPGTMKSRSQWQYLPNVGRINLLRHRSRCRFWGGGKGGSGSFETLYSSACRKKDLATTLHIVVSSSMHLRNHVHVSQ
ncbi:uncharacterized protein F4812DRAFT_414689 [Daldinia caldariorum]|uniref:uncharacterized protein n=1 Tax=Daldinia caldariorum TaxID=326644 RepID=UPI002008834B|nr:uncharacterized protein F4812DRAFT_414689 [Daldinia caldariorum]KAI1471596.1 hypothetical protein F4812DRAFT_414689 [Daldinia caldariorum]